MQRLILRATSSVIARSSLPVGSGQIAHPFEFGSATRRSTPNARLIEIGDHVLGRGGRLVAAVKAIGRGADYVGDSPFLFSASPVHP